MNEQERLEAINKDIDMGIKVWGISIADIKWLYEQAEEKIKLQDRVEELEHRQKSNLSHIEELSNSLFDKYKLVARYKQALELYADEDNYEFETIVSDCEIDVDSKILEDGGEVARRELRGGSK